MKCKFVSVNCTVLIHITKLDISLRWSNQTSPLTIYSCLHSSYCCKELLKYFTCFMWNLLLFTVQFLSALMTDELNEHYINTVRVISTINIIILCMLEKCKQQLNITRVPVDRATLSTFRPVGYTQTEQILLKAIRLK